MSDPTDPRWAPPGDAGPSSAPLTDDDGREPTVQFSSEETRRIARPDPPPPPPPPHASGGWAPPPTEAGPAGYGPGGWQPPPAPRRRTGLVVGIIVGVLLLVTVLGAAAVLVVRATDGGPTDAPQPAITEGGQAVPDDAPGPGGDVPADDLVAQTETVLQTINRSEERMIGFQEAVLEAVGEDGTIGDAAAEVARAAQSAGDDLTGLRTELQALAGGDAEGFEGLRDIRDTYATHMEAWIDYVDAVAGSPALAAPGSPDAEPFWREIELSGNDFVAAVESGMPSDVPASLEDLARFIVERGFGGFDSDSPGDVV